MDFLLFWFVLLGRPPTISNRVKQRAIIKIIKRDVFMVIREKFKTSQTKTGFKPSQTKTETGTNRETGSILFSPNSLVWQTHTKTNDFRINISCSKMSPLKNNLCFCSLLFIFLPVICSWFWQGKHPPNYLLYISGGYCHYGQDGNYHCHPQLYSLSLSTNSSWNLNQNNDIVVYTNKYELSENIFLSDNQRQKKPA
jgi:hypothetical protein